nr:helix-turn-helix domain-containing protein [Streptomyces sp. SID8352]
MRSERHLNGREREEISRGLAAGESARQLAKRLGRSPSTQKIAGGSVDDEEQRFSGGSGGAATRRISMASDSSSVSAGRTLCAARPGPGQKRWLRA